MLNALSYRFQMRRLLAKRRKVRQAYMRDRKRAIKKKSSQESISEIDSEYILDDEIFENDIIMLRSRHIIQLAEKLFLPIPEIGQKIPNGSWVYSADGSRKVHLKAKAQHELWDSIRKEKSYRRSQFISWVTIIAGLGGVLIGIISLLKQK